MFEVPDQQPYTYELYCRLAGCITSYSQHAWASIKSQQTTGDLVERPSFQAYGNVLHKPKSLKIILCLVVDTSLSAEALSPPPTVS
jgi:hypothetical protein